MRKNYGRSKLTIDEFLDIYPDEKKRKIELDKATMFCRNVKGTSSYWKG